jgi:predicted membrane-bound mannosyltransferase
MLLSIGMTLLIFGFFIKSVWSANGLLKLPGSLAMAVMLFFLIKIEIDIYRNPTSHNLLPFEYIFWGITSLLIYWITRVGIGWLVHRNRKQ